MKLIYRLRLNKISLQLLLIILPNILWSQYTPKSNDAWLLEQAGLQNVHEADSTIRVNLMYATSDNFVGECMYTQLREAYLQPKAVAMLIKAHDYLKEENKNLRFVIKDAARPQYVQKIMWEKVRGTPKQNYVANPAKISMHSFGVAVDLTIINVDGSYIDMGTEVDYLGKLAEPRHEESYLREGKLSKLQVDNRQLLRKVMLKAGFRFIPNEWWHFEACTKADAKREYLPIK